MKQVLSMILIAVFLVSFSLAAVEEEIPIKTRASECLNISEELIDELTEAGFNTQRAQDRLFEGKTYFEVQKSFEQGGRRHDYEETFVYCNEIKDIREKAFEATDNLFALEEFYKDSLTQEMDTRSADELITRIKKEINDERYENTELLIDKAYEEIINIKSEHTTLNLVLESTQAGIASFFQKYYKVMLITLVIFITLWFIFRKRIHKYTLQKKLKHTELRKGVLTNLIMKTQKEYFDNGNISESAYKIKTEKFGQMIRDMNREASLVKEELAKLDIDEKAKK